MRSQNKNRSQAPIALYLLDILTLIDILLIISTLQGCSITKKTTIIINTHSYKNMDAKTKKIWEEIFYPDSTNDSTFSKMEKLQTSTNDVQSTKKVQKKLHTSNQKRTFVGQLKIQI